MNLNIFFRYYFFFFSDILFTSSSLTTLFDTLFCFVRPVFFIFYFLLLFPFWYVLYAYTCFGHSSFSLREKYDKQTLIHYENGKKADRKKRKEFFKEIDFRTNKYD